MNTAMTRAPNGTLTTRDEFGATEMTAHHETATTALAAQATAAMQARYVMALKRPRDWADVRVRLLRECERTSFAQVAIYHKPIGKGIEGPSIRFAEAALRYMTNVAPETFTIYDDMSKRILRVSVTDLEANLVYTKDIVVDKVVERRKLKDGQNYIAARTNSTGETVYLVEATEDDLLNKEGALVSKALRTLALRLLPGDILEECMRKIYETLRADVSKDPDGECKRVADAFASLGVKPSELKEYLGHALESASPAEIVELRKVYVAIKDGEATWADVVGEKGTPKEEEPKEAKPRAKTLADKIKAKAAAASPQPATPANDSDLQNVPEDPDLGP